MQDKTKPENDGINHWGKRLDELEGEYEAAHTDLENLRRMEELGFQIAGLMGKNNRNLLREYTDRLIARYNTDVGWYYRRGVEDGRAYSCHMRLLNDL